MGLLILDFYMGRFGVIYVSSPSHWQLIIVLPCPRCLTRASGGLALSYFVHCRSIHCSQIVWMSLSILDFYMGRFCELFPSPCSRAGLSEWVSEPRSTTQQREAARGRKEGVKLLLCLWVLSIIGEVRRQQRAWRACRCGGPSSRTAITSKASSVW